MFGPVGRGQQVVAAGEPSSTRNGSRSEIRLYKCEGWEHTGATEDGTGCGWCQKETGGLPAPGSPRHPEVVLDGEIRAYKREEWEHTGAEEDGMCCGWCEREMGGLAGQPVQVTAENVKFRK